MQTYHIIMDDDKLGVKPEILFSLYLSIDANAKALAPADIRHELSISQNGKIKTRFGIAVSERMAPFLVRAVQVQAEKEVGMGLKSYFYKLQEQLMAHMLGPLDQTMAVNIKYEGKLI